MQRHNGPLWPIGACAKLSYLDIHPDQFYKVHTSTEKGNACHRGKGPAGTYGAETSDCDTPASLVNATFDWISANLKDQIDFIIWTGDSARHDSDENIPRSRAQVLGSNRWIADKFAEILANPDGDGLSIPVVPTLGNNDILPHNILAPGPNKWLRNYDDIWRRFIPEEQRHSFEFGGWFYVEVIPNKLAVFSLNTLYLFDRNAAIDNCVNPAEPGFKQLEWLRIQLGFMRERGVKAILMGHVPPARTSGKQLWDETCWQKYTLWLQQYRDVIVGSVYGHMNLDHFFLQDTNEIQLSLITGAEAATARTRQPMEDEMSAQSREDYLQELRHEWSKLKPPATGASEDAEPSRGKKKKKKGKKSDPWSERYQVSMISPSVVPNYFPTLRVVEYNITGLEDIPVWSDGARYTLDVLQEEDQERLELRDIWDTDSESTVEDMGQGGETNKKKKKKKKKPKQPSLVVPDPPSKSATPGPAYSPQPLTLTGYTQYFANLTYINNDLTKDGAEGPGIHTNSHSVFWFLWPEWLQLWREGKHRYDEPKNTKPKPKEFEYEVEYDTFTDRTYKLPDLTVKSFAELAYRMGKACGGDKEVLNADGEGDEGDEEARYQQQDSDSDDDETDSESDLEDNSDSEDEELHGWEAKKKKKKNGKKNGSKEQVCSNKKKKKADKVWLHFLQHAFVRTVDKKELKKLC